MASSAPYPPHHLPLSTALKHSEPLANLLKRVLESQARLALISPLLPAALRPFVSAGPLDDVAWVLLAANAAAAAKLRQLQPELQAALLAAGHDGPVIKIKVSASA